MFKTMSSTSRTRILFGALFYAAVAGACLLIAAGKAAAGPLGQARETIFIPPPEDARIVEVAARRGGGAALKWASRNDDSLNCQTAPRLARS